VRQQPEKYIHTLLTVSAVRRYNSYGAYDARVITACATAALKLKNAVVWCTLRANVDLKAAAVAAYKGGVPTTCVLLPSPGTTMVSFRCMVFSVLH
jgi:hypothetical protein